MAFQGNIGFDLHFWCDLNIDIDIGRIRIDKAHPIDHVGLVNATTHDAFCCCKGHAVVNPKTFIKIFERIGPDFFTSFTENTDDIRDIVFTLGIVSVDIFQSFKEARIVKDISPCIDFFNLFFKICRIFLLNNSKHFRIVIADNPTIAKWISCFGCQNRCYILVVDMKVDQVFEAFTRNQRSITCDDKSMPFKTFQDWLCHHYRMTSSQLFGLFNKFCLSS